MRTAQGAGVILKGLAAALVLTLAAAPTSALAEDDSPTFDAWKSEDPDAADSWLDSAKDQFPDLSDDELKKLYDEWNDPDADLMNNPPPSPQPSGGGGSDDDDDDGG